MPGYASAFDEAEARYDVVRQDEGDVAAIAAHTGLKIRNVGRVKEHLFIQVHLLDRYAHLGEPPEHRRFDALPGIARLWSELRSGVVTHAALELLRHETAEAWYMRRHGPGYTAAHAAAQRRFPAPARLQEDGS